MNGLRAGMWLVRAFTDGGLEIGKRLTSPDMDWMQKAVREMAMNGAVIARVRLDTPNGAIQQFDVDSDGRVVHSSRRVLREPTR